MIAEHWDASGMQPAFLQSFVAYKHLRLTTWFARKPKKAKWREAIHAMPCAKRKKSRLARLCDVLAH